MGYLHTLCFSKTLCYFGFGHEVLHFNFALSLLLNLLVLVTLGSAFLTTKQGGCFKQVRLCTNSVIGTKRSDHSKEVAI